MGSYLATSYTYTFVFKPLQHTHILTHILMHATIHQCVQNVCRMCAECVQNVCRMACNNHHKLIIISLMTILLGTQLIKYINK